MCMLQITEATSIIQPDYQPKAEAQVDVVVLEQSPVSFYQS
jgi:hypothetical protein